MRLTKARSRQIALVGFGSITIFAYQNCSSGAFHAMQAELASSQSTSSTNAQIPSTPSNEAAPTVPSTPNNDQAVVPNPAPSAQPTPSPAPAPVAEPSPRPAPAPVVVQEPAPVVPVVQPQPPPVAPIPEQPTGIPVPNAPAATITSADLIPVYFKWGINAGANSLIPSAGSVPSFYLYARNDAGRARLATTMSQGLQVNPSNNEFEFLGYASLAANDLATVAMRMCTYHQYSPQAPTSTMDVSSIWFGRECPATYTWGSFTYTFLGSSIVGYVIPMNAATLAIHPVANSSPQATLPIGYYRQQVGEDPFFSNGVDAICHYVGMTRFTGGAAAPGRITAAYLPSQMRDDGLCP